MRIEYENKFLDLFLFNILHFFLMLRVHVLVMLLMVYVFWSYRYVGDNPLGYSLFVTLKYFISYWLFIFILYAFYLYFRDNRSVLTKHSIELTDDYLLEETKYNKSYFYWPGINKIVQRPGFIAVYISANGAHVIPNRAFPSRSEREKFVMKLFSRFPDR